LKNGSNGSAMEWSLMKRIKEHTSELSQFWHIISYGQMGTACKRGRMMDVQVMVKTVYFINFYSQGNKRIWLHVPGIKICWGEGVRKYTCICTNSGINHARYTVHVLWSHAQSTICANCKPFFKN
jgi:hypothetical protein